MRLHVLFERGKANGLAGLEWLSAERLKELEPHAAGVATIRVPEEGIVDYRGVDEKMVEVVLAVGGEFRAPCSRLTFTNSNK